MAHDTRSAYDSGCRCAECTQANTAVPRARSERAMGHTPATALARRLDDEDSSLVTSSSAAVAPKPTIPSPAPRPDRAYLEREVFRHLSDHAASEAEFIASYRELAEAPATPDAVRYLMGLLLEDEERHHRVLHEIATAIGNRVTLRHDPDAVPDLPYEPPDRVLEEVTGRFLAAERADAKQLRALRKELRPFRDTSLWALLVELMEHDTAKHIRLLTFIRDHVARQPRRYLAVNRALDPLLQEVPEPEWQPLEETPTLPG